MSMRPCEKCLENTWEFQHIENLIRATCKLCGHEVEFTPRTKDKYHQGDPCKKCGSPIKQQSHKGNWKRSDSQSYYFAWWYKCLKCHAVYLVPSARREILKLNF